MTQPSEGNPLGTPRHPLEIFAEDILEKDEYGRGIGPRGAISIGAKAIQGLMVMPESTDGHAIDPTVRAAAIEALGAMVGGFASGRQEVDHHGSVRLQAHVDGISASGRRHHSGTVHLISGPETPPEPAADD